MTTINFKSNPIMYAKESTGRKNNTVRKLPDDQERINLLTNWNPGNTLFIEITNSENDKLCFKRMITDITYWNGVWIISW